MEIVNHVKSSPLKPIVQWLSQHCENVTPPVILEIVLKYVNETYYKVINLVPNLNKACSLILFWLRNKIK